MGARIVDPANSRCEASDVIEALMRFHRTIIGRRSVRHKGPLGQLPFIRLNDLCEAVHEFLPALRRRAEAAPRWRRAAIAMRPKQSGQQPSL